MALRHDHMHWSRPLTKLLPRLRGFGPRTTSSQLFTARSQMTAAEGLASIAAEPAGATAPSSSSSPALRRLEDIKFDNLVLRQFAVENAPASEGSRTRSVRAANFSRVRMTGAALLQAMRVCATGSGAVTHSAVRSGTASSAVGASPSTGALHCAFVSAQPPMQWHFSSLQAASQRS